MISNNCSSLTLSSLDFLYLFLYILCCLFLFFFVCFVLFFFLVVFFLLLYFYYFFKKSLLNSETKLSFFPSFFSNYNTTTNIFNKIFLKKITWIINISAF